MESGNKHIRGTGRERVYNFIVEFIKKNVYAPSIREFTYYDVPLKGDSKKLLTCAWFNNPGIEVDKVINKLEELKKNSPDHIVEYYEKTLKFIKYTNNSK